MNMTDLQWLSVLINITSTKIDFFLQFIKKPARTIASLYISVHEYGRSPVTVCFYQHYFYKNKIFLQFIKKPTRKITSLYRSEQGYSRSRVLSVLINFILKIEKNWKKKRSRAHIEILSPKIQIDRRRDSSEGNLAIWAETDFDGKEHTR